jgi:hypothetical protein
MSEAKDSAELGKAMAQGFKEGIERAENATKEETRQYYESMGNNRVLYDMMRGNLLAAGYDADEIMSFEEWGKCIRNFPENMKRVFEAAKRAMYENSTKIARK